MSGEQILHELYESPGKGPDYLHRCILRDERREDHFGNRLMWTQSKDLLLLCTSLHYVDIKRYSWLEIKITMYCFNGENL
ncbi:hypothetical protein DPMN_049345 [Dreissena polymorpha]|uniref:Uncharacterized protein n=1 Tax=Dreissena polymorpha TaxID=45954 RepID=A0A9D4CF65_DREPO|nr:hypothetical protein DPMN_049345 [Dreissena polymorpha]